MTHFTGIIDKISSNVGDCGCACVEAFHVTKKAIGTMIHPKDLTIY